VHQALRERLAILRQEAAAGGSPSGASSALGSGDLLSHCLSFCTAIHTHHTGEDTQLFPALQAAAPELAPVIGKLIEDHTLVAGILRQLQDLLAAPTGPETLGRELDGLTAILESHFSFEERRIAAALDALGPGAQFPEVFSPEDGS
jgi:hypothetical protein